MIYGDQSMSLALEPVFHDPGHYQAIFFPSATGAYTFHITGNIKGKTVDETFEPGPDTFSEVKPIEPFQFPKQSGSAPDSSSLAWPAGAGVASLALAATGWWLGRRRSGRDEAAA